MSGILLTVAGSVVVALLALAGTILTVRQSRQGQRDTRALDTRKVDLDEFREVQARNEAALEWSARAFERLERELGVERKARERSDRRVVQLEDVMRAGGMPIPPHLPDPL